ncbi:MAG: tetratricopeptide repeat protein [Chitinophagaceae bacterium]|nr:tetratricopeptide repeat protein [Chitinophagaceae bacterium]
MKKTAITFLISGMLFAAGLKAQTIQEGVNHLYAGRVKSASAVFDKLLAVNPTNIDAIYWQGQVFLDDEEIRSSRLANARAWYEKGIQATNGAPLLQVGLGHIELLEGKVNEARQHFETALTLTRGKKGDDPIIETVIGRAISDAKNADYDYAVRLLEDAANKDPKNTMTLLELGNAYRKAGKGNGGGAAFASYKKALEADPNFAAASYRLGMLFTSQKNEDLTLEYMNQAVAKDPKFTKAYYELFYFYFYRLKFAEAEDQLKKYIDSKAPDTDPQDQFLYAQLCYAKKDFDCAIAKGEAVVAVTGANTKPKVYRLLAHAYFDKGDFQNARKNSDLFFAKKNPDEYMLPDYEVRALALAKLGSVPDDVVKAYLEGIGVDTTVEAKLGYLKKGAAYFKEQKLPEKQAVVLAKILDLKPKPIINDYFDLTLAYYFSGAYDSARNRSIQMKEKFPDQVYGYQWAFNSAIAVDTVKQDSIAVPDALVLYEFAEKDTSKFKSQYISAVKFLAAYYINKAKDKEKSLDFFRKWQAADVNNAAAIQTYIDQIEKMPAGKPGSKPANNSKGTGQTSTLKSPKPAVIAKSKTTLQPKAPAKG